MNAEGEDRLQGHDAGDATDPGEPLRRLDPDRAAQTLPAPPLGPEAEPEAPGPRYEEPVGFDPSRYQWLAGGIGLALVIGFSIYLFTSTHGSGTTGVPPGRPLRPFAAPLATSTLVGDANLQPPCTAAHHDPRALNTCLLVQRGPVVLAFFVADAGACERSVDAMQDISSRFAPRGVQFAAVAIRAGPKQAAAVVRRHGWTIPVAYDRDGGVASSYAIEVCPLLELVRRGGIVDQRLIGDHWSDPAALAAQVGKLTGP